MPRCAQALARLLAWNHEESTDSVAAAIYEVWATKYLGKTTVAKAAPEAARKLIGNGQLQAVIEYLEHPDGALGADPKAARDAVLLESLQGARGRTHSAAGPRHDDVGLGPAASRDLRAGGRRPGGS